MEDRVKRRLAAILAIDVVGYSRLMEIDEVGTLAMLKARRRDIVAPLVASHDGRVAKVMGDGLLVEFASAVNAVQCVIDLQESFAEANLSLPEARRILLRVGINLGDVIVEGGDLYGDGVNVAARLESLAGPGEIWISASVYDQVKRKLEASFDDLGPKALKNIAEPVHVYRARAVPVPAAKAQDAGRTLPLPSKPSIAVLPFTNISGEADQDVFTDGLSEDIINDLSRNTGLFVIARHSTFVYKGESVDVRQIARDLGVRYILEAVHGAQQAACASTCN
jgi:class 3 adenylate cyclase